VYSLRPEKLSSLPALLFWLSGVRETHRHQIDFIGLFLFYREEERTLNSVALFLKRTIPTERLPHVGQVNINFCE
jgi:hypothetical protein